MVIRRDDLEAVGELAAYLTMNLNDIDSRVSNEDKSRLLASRSDARTLIQKAVRTDAADPAGRIREEDLLTGPQITGAPPGIPPGMEVIPLPPPVPVFQQPLPVVDLPPVDDHQQLKLPFVDQPNVGRPVQFTTLQQLADYIKERLDKIEYDNELIKQLLTAIKQNTLKKKKVLYESKTVS